MKKETEYINGIVRFSKKSTPENTEEMLRRLRFNEKNRKIIHVAGTNGKGSVCSYIANILTASGKSTGLFTSPHLCRMNERIAANGRDVTDAEFEESFGRVKAVAESMVNDGYTHPSFFEFLFGMAMDIFETKNVEYIVLETGLGGRLDATNVFRKPVVTIITSIGLDHTEILGDTYAEIAWEKAGIIKPGVPVIFENSNADVTGVIKEKAAEAGSDMIILENSHISEIKVNDKNIDFCLHNKYYDNECFTVNGRGLYQVHNAALAAMAVKACGLADDEAVHNGIAATVWRARMQEIMPDVVLDGAHNDDGITQFIASVKEDGCRHGRILLFSAVKDKHYEGMAGIICGSGLFDITVTCRINDPRGLDVEELTRIFRRHGVDAEYAGSVREGLEKAIEYKKEGMKLYIAGSLYLAGEVLSITEGEKA